MKMSEGDQSGPVVLLVLLVPLGLFEGDHQGDHIGEII